MYFPNENGEYFLVYQRVPSVSRCKIPSSLYPEDLRLHQLTEQILTCGARKAQQVTPPKTNMDTKNDGWKRWLLLNMAIFGIYVRFLGGTVFFVFQATLSCGESLGVSS